MIVPYLLDLERKERKDSETRALGLIREAKRKWDNATKDEIAQLKKHIDVQTTRITDLCTSNNDMSSRLQRTECELQTANAELDKLRVFQVSNIMYYFITYYIYIKMLICIKVSITLLIKYYS